MRQIISLCAEGTGQTDRRGGVRDTNMWKLAAQVSDQICYVSGVGVQQGLSKLRMATGWGATAKSVQLVDHLRQALEKVDEPPLILGFGGSRGVAVLLRAVELVPEITIHAVVLLDAVYSFGLFWWEWLDKKLYPYEVPENIQQALHVVALHEDTPGFSPVIFPARPGLLQVACQGDHTEILRGPEAERISLSWLKTLGVEKRFQAPANGWGAPTRQLALPSYWDLAP